VRFVWHPNRTHVFAINPLGIPFEVVAIEAEQAIQGAFSVGANFSYFSPSDSTRSSFEVKGRLYPNEEAPRVFAVGRGLGAKPILGDADAFDSAPFVYGTARFLIGVAF